GIAEEDFADRRGLAGEDEGCDAGNANREPAAIPARAFVEKTIRVAHETEGGDNTGPRRKRRRFASIPVHECRVPRQRHPHNPMANERSLRAPTRASVRNRSPASSFSPGEKDS